MPSQSPTGLGYTGEIGATAPALGGRIEVFLAPTAILLVGDAVFISAANTVNKSIVAGDQVKRCGIVVGGDSTGMAVTTDPVNDVGKSACSAAAGQRVLVCVSGVAYGIADAAIAAAGTQLKLGATTAGRLAAATPTTDAGKIVGINIEVAAGAASVMKVLIDLA